MPGGGLIALVQCGIADMLLADKHGIFAHMIKFNGLFEEN
jgi:hypothetical protein